LLKYPDRVNHIKH